MPIVCFSLPIDLYSVIIHQGWVGGQQNAYLCLHRVRGSFWKCLRKQNKIRIFHFSGVHVLLVSLLVDQLSGLFLIFLVDQKKNCLVSETGQKKFGQSLNFFWPVSLLEGEQKSQRLAKKKSETDQIFFVWSLRLANFFFGWPKKWEIDWTNGRPRDWPNVHGRRFCGCP